MSIIACDGTIDDPIPEYDVLATVNEDDGRKNYYLVYGSAYFQLIIILFVYSICLFIKTINVNYQVVNVVGLLCCCCFIYLMLGGQSKYLGYQRPYCTTLIISIIKDDVINI